MVVHCLYHDLGICSCVEFEDEGSPYLERSVFQGEQPDDEEVFALLASLKRIYAFYRWVIGICIYCIPQICYM